MKRVQLYVEVNVYEEAKLRAARAGTSVALLVREAMAEYLAKPAPYPALGDDPMDRIAGIMKGGPDDASETVDEAVYGLPPKRRRRR